jgi:hypothetical protein
LRQFIDARPAQQFTYPCHAKIVPVHLRDDWSILENCHRAEFEDDKFLAVEATSSLAEYDWTGTIEQDGNRGNHEKRPKKRYYRHGNNDVDNPLDRSLKPGPLIRFFVWGI